MKRYKRSDLRGGITLHDTLWRWGYVHERGGPSVEEGDWVMVGGWLYKVTRIHYVTYRSHDAYAVISLRRFRWLEVCVVGGLTGLVFALII